MSENIESMVNSECRAETEEVADMLKKMPRPTQEKLEAFLMALDFIEYWNKKPA